MDAATIAVWIQFAIWTIAAICGLFKLVQQWRKEGPMSLSLKGIYLALLLGFAVSGTSLYFNYRPRIVEKPVERIVEKIVPQECPKAPVCPKASNPQQASKQPPQIAIPRGSKIEATTNAPDSAAVGVNTGTVTVNPPVNPYRPVITYELNGFKRETSPGKTIGDDSAVAEYRQLKDLQDAHDWKALAQMSEQEIEKRPEWLTPYLFAGIAYANLGDKDAAIKKLEYVNDKAAGLKEYGDAGRILQILKPH